MTTVPTHVAPDPAVVAALRHMIMGFRTTQLLYVAARLGIADLLRDGPQSAMDLAQTVSAEPGALYRLLRALASLGVFAETDAGQFEFTPLAALLQRDSVGSLRGIALLYGDEWLWDAYGRMFHSVQTGETAFSQLHGQPLYEYLKQYPDAGTVFNGAMSSFTDLEAGAILAAYDFSEVSRLVDVGGGQGALLAAILKAYPQLNGVLFDLPSVVQGAQPGLTQMGVSDRVEVVGGDFFASLPAGGDAYLLKSVLHNWDDARGVSILKNCRTAMREAGRLLAIERVIGPPNEPSEAKLFDINMLVVVGGRERTEAEYQALFAAAGFRLTRVIATRSPLSIIEGIPQEFP